MGIVASDIRTGGAGAAAVRDWRPHPLIAWLAVTLLAAAGFVLLSIWTPSDAPGASICLLRRVGLSCPTCGMTRALAFLAKGEWRAAFAQHPLAPLLAFEGFAAWLVSGALIITGRWRGLPWRVVNVAIVAHAAVFLAVWIARLF